jgi:hypothetical protein
MVDATLGTRAAGFCGGHTDSQDRMDQQDTDSLAAAG